MYSSDHKKFLYIIFIALFFTLMAGWLIPFFEQIITNGKKVKKIFFYLKVANLSGAYMSFMLVGTSLYYWDSKYWSGKKTFFTIILLMITSKYCLLHYQGYTPELHKNVYDNHVYAFWVFLILMLLEKWLPFSKFFNKVGNVSYALYLTHATGSYALFYILFRATNNIWVTLSLVFIWIILSTLIIHHHVELPSIRLAKKIIEFKKKNFC